MKRAHEDDRRLVYETVDLDKLGRDSHTALFGCGHAPHGSGPPITRDHRFYPRLGEYGGSADGNAAARADSWPRVIAFLRRTMAGS